MENVSRIEITIFYGLVYPERLPLLILIIDSDNGLSAGDGWLQFFRNTVGRSDGIYQSTMFAWSQNSCARAVLFIVKILGILCTGLARFFG
jgi:hypothetical protein